jgi:hypothetical protein
MMQVRTCQHLFRLYAARRRYRQHLAPLRLRGSLATRAAVDAALALEHCRCTRVPHTADVPPPPCAWCASSH